MSDSSPVEQNFQTLCRAIRAGDTMLVEVRSYDMSKVEWYICAVNHLDGGSKELLPIAVMICEDLEPLVLPGETSEQKPWQNN